MPDTPVMDRVAVNAAVDRLVGPGGTFDPADASLVIAAAPTQRMGAVLLAQVGWEGADRRVGGYLLFREAGEVHIDLVIVRDRRTRDPLPPDELGAILDYDVRTGRAKGLRRQRTVRSSVTVWPWPRLSFGFNRKRFVPWKTPSAT